jgi:hypothetical protein
MKARIILAASMLVSIGACNSLPHIPSMPSSERTLTTATETTIPAGTQFRTPDGSVGITTEPAKVTLPEGTKIEGGWGAVLWWLFAVGGIFVGWKIAERIIKRRKAAPSKPFIPSPNQGAGQEP